MIVQQLPPDPYRQRIVFLYGTAEWLTKWCARNHPNANTPVVFHPSHNGKFFEFTPSDGRNSTQYIALVKRRTSRDNNAMWLAHECLHCAVAVIEAKGIPINGQNDEALTYYFQWLFEHCLRYLRTA